MDLHLTPGSIGIIIAILAHAGTSIWYASKLASKVVGMTESLQRIDKELEKRDAQISSVHRRVDELQKEVYTLKGGQHA